MYEDIIAKLRRENVTFGPMLDRCEFYKSGDILTVVAQPMIARILAGEDKRRIIGDAFGCDAVRIISGETKHA